MPNYNLIIIGAGPAGLGCGCEAVNRGLRPLVLEQDTVVGGIARTAMFQGYRLDVGPHRFFTKESQIAQVWHNMLGDDFLPRSRLTRIYYNERLFEYPVKLIDVLRKLGIAQSLLVLSSYIQARISPIAEPLNFEQWVTNQFGRRLYELFFKTYTEKVWGMPCHEISADWAAQRIKSLSLGEALKNALGISHRRHTSLIEQFHYPRLGAGMMWERIADHITDHSGHIAFGHRVGQLNHRDGQVISVLVQTDTGYQEHSAHYFVSSMPLPELVLSLQPSAPARIQEAARALRHRHLVIVVLIIDNPTLFPDNWIYVHAPEVAVGRIQNYKNWGLDMVPDPTKTSLGLEYFCWEDDDLWEAAEENLIELGTQECATLNLIDPDQVATGTVLRMPKAYPVYDSGYARHVALIREYLSSFSNLQVVGRNGMHRYNNMDHSMMTGLLAARNICGEDHDLWGVNVGEEYLEVADKQ